MRESKEEWKENEKRGRPTILGKMGENLKKKKGESGGAKKNYGKKVRGAYGDVGV